MAHLLTTHNLSVGVDGHELLHHVDLCIPGGEVHALLGPNGCSKTTLLIAIMGYPRYQITGGSILFDSIDITEWDITQRAKLGITLAHQRPPTLAGVTLRHLLACILDHEAEAMQQSETLATAFRMQSLLDRNINAGLSGGEIKRSELFQMLAIHPKFALLDEPDSGIDLESLAVVGHMVSEVVTPAADCPDLRSALLVTHTGHILDHVKVDKAHIMVEGQVVCSGEPASLMQEIRRHGFQAYTRLTKETEGRLIHHANDLSRAK